MTEEEPKSEIPNDLDEDIAEVISALKPEVTINAYGPDKHKLVFNTDELRRVLDRHKNRSEKIIWQSGGELGINIMLESTQKTITELHEMAKKDLIYLRDNIPIKKMFGVG